MASARDARLAAWQVSAMESAVLAMGEERLPSAPRRPGGRAHGTLFHGVSPFLTGSRILTS